MYGKPIIVDYKIALAKMAKYCAYQERCHWEIERRFKEWNIDEDIWDDITADLIQQNFLSEERFAIAYVQGKVNIKKWGKTKIFYELKKRQISEYLINKSLAMIDEEKYILNLQEIITKKKLTIKGRTDYEREAKLTTYLFSRGYDIELIKDYLK
ncbi:MAG: RecX family transcriptional regulator [Bacteroidales bacterium]|nr:RecX family transcriptional regulator [Bacteroidales bacterium]